MSRREASRSFYSLRFVAAVTIAAFSTELLIMIVLRRSSLNTAAWGEALLDAATLVMVLLPALYIFLARPLERQISQRRSTEERLVNIVDTAHDAVIVVDEAKRILLFNQGAERTFGRGAAEALGQPLDLLLEAGAGHDSLYAMLRSGPAMSEQLGDSLNLSGRRQNGDVFPAEASISRLTLDGHTTYTIILRDVTARRLAEEALRRAHDELEERVRERTVELAALLASSKAVLDNREFDGAARAIVTASRGLAGARAGCMLLLGENREAARLKVLEGVSPVEPVEAIPLGGLSERVCDSGTAAFDNGPVSGPQGWPAGAPGSLLFAPLRVNGAAVGLLGLADKPGGFTENDTAMASAFAELAAIALRNSLTLNSLENLAAEMGARADVLDAVFAAIADAVFVFDAQGGPLRVNPAAVAMYGGAPENALRPLGPEGPRLRHMDGRPLAPEERPAARALRGETAQNTYMQLTNAQGRHLAIAATASPLHLDDKVSGAVVVWHDISEHEQLTALEERQRLARELHDSLSQALYGISLGTQAARGYLEANPAKVAESLDYVLSLAELSLTEMRALIFELRPESLAAEGLVSGLRKQAAVIQARNGFPVVVELGEEPAVPLELKEACLRIAQEAMNNSVRHARASRLRLCLASAGGRLTLEVEDNGAGFDPAADHPGHLGLTSMRERAALVGAALSVRSAPGQGTLVRAEFQIDGAAA